MSAVITVEGLSKKYRIGETQESYKTLRDTLTNVMSAPVRRLRSTFGKQDERKREATTFWALKDVSFEVKQGEAVGIIGRNGAGKSTLLKILSRITDPTTGSVDISGRVGSLLEVGTGFHPELTGRENIFLNGAILGMKRTLIARKFDEIVAFAEIDKFIDTPVKYYSSGMYTRLAFAVAAHLEPEVLIVDEVLAVGDARFQKKCVGKMGDVAKEGRTVLFVSHNMAAVKSLCQRAIFLEKGKQVASGLVAEVLDIYLDGEIETSNERTWADMQTAPGNEKARVHSVRILSADGEPATQADIEDSLVVEIEYQVLKPDTIINLSISLYTRDGTYVFASPSTTDSSWFQRPHPAGVFRSRCLIPRHTLNQGRYSITVILVENGNNIVTQLDNIVSVDMVDLGNMRGSFFGHWGGVVRPKLDWETECCQSVFDSAAAR